MELSRLLSLDPDFADIILCFEIMRDREAKRSGEVDVDGDGFIKLVASTLCSRGALAQSVARKRAQAARNSMQHYTYDGHRLFSQGL